MVKILFFGHLAEITGVSEVIWKQVPDDTAQLREQLLVQYPSLAATPFTMAVNRQVISDEILLLDGAEIALLPPFSGG